MQEQSIRQTPAEDGIVTVPLTLGLYTRVAANDHAMVAGFVWCAAKVRHTVYARTYTGGSSLFMHRLILGAKQGEFVDHIDGDGLNNTRVNLRICTASENVQNRHRVAGKSRFQGVYKDASRRRWRAAIVCRGVRCKLGTFETEEAAALAYDAKAKKLFGRFARLNFPEVGNGG